MMKSIIASLVVVCVSTSDVINLRRNLQSFPQVVEHSGWTTKADDPLSRTESDDLTPLNDYLTTVQTSNEAIRQNINANNAASLTPIALAFQSATYAKNDATLGTEDATYLSLMDAFNAASGNGLQTYNAADAPLVNSNLATGSSEEQMGRNISSAVNPFITKFFGNP